MRRLTATTTNAQSKPQPTARPMNTTPHPAPALAADPDFDEFKSTASLRLIVSVDLRGSTFMKTSAKIKDPWILEIGGFYQQFPMLLGIGYDQKLPAYCKNESFATQRRLEVFKLQGDEMLFQVPLDQHQQAVTHLQAVKHAIRTYNSDEQTVNVLRAKATAWLCGLPVTDFQIKNFSYEMNGKKIAFPPDFVGPSMDIGFRLAHSARTRKLVVSYDLALMLIHGLQKSKVSPDAREMHFFYDGSESFKGVLGGFPYPVIWVNIYDSVPAPEEKLKGVQKNACNLDELEHFCREFRTEHGLPKWFITTDPDPDYTGPDEEWLAKYKEYKTQLRKRGLDKDDCVATEALG